MSFHSAMRWSTQSLRTTVQQIKDYKISTPFKQVNLLLISLSHLFARSQANLLPKRCNGTFLGVVNAIPSIFTASTLCGYLVRVRLIHGLSPHAYFQKPSLCMFQAYGASVDPLSVMVSLSETLKRHTVKESRLGKETGALFVCFL